MDAEEKQVSPRPFRYYWSNKELRDVQFTKETKSIQKGMSSSFPKCILAWSSTKGHSSPDFVVKALSSSDREVELKHSWTLSEEGKLSWSGTVAVYQNWARLAEAARHIINNLEDIRVLWFTDMVNLLITAERNHPLFGESYTKVIIKGRRSLDKHESQELQRLLKEYGEVKLTKLRKGKTKFDKIAEVEYRFATHAFVAKLQINGMALGALGYLHAEIEETEKEKDIREEVTSRLIERFKTF